VKKAKVATGEDVLELSVAVIELYFRLEAITQATAGFAQAGGEFGVLRSLVMDGAQTVPQIANARPVSRQHCQTIVNGLAEQGLVEFADNPRHKKSKLVRVTKKGRARFAAMKTRFTEVAGAYAPHFGAAEVHAAIDVCRRARTIIVV
jgi:DNA-binding MarR family transcriptional regulator